MLKESTKVNDGDSFEEEKKKRIKAHNMDELEKVEMPEEVKPVFRGANVERVKGKLKNLDF